MADEEISVPLPPAPIPRGSSGSTHMVVSDAGEVSYTHRNKHGSFPAPHQVLTREDTTFWSSVARRAEEMAAKFGS
jgi:hypothetical protein